MKKHFYEQPDIQVLDTTYSAGICATSNPTLGSGINDYLDETFDWE